MELNSDKILTADIFKQIWEYSSLESNNLYQL